MTKQQILYLFNIIFLAHRKYYPYRYNPHVSVKIIKNNYKSSYEHLIRMIWFIISM
uniref:Uncharacterized protein n=1 Tax=Solanum lycopersicum TaxID=4081 RepID=A0A3Q7HEI6_SOLLC